ncbi:glycoside hydrolase family 125 protein [Mucilaginibacter myungsuensis]|uniref:Glycoside hydrolase family 125 protein n=1 Tax=Mucilaginibacter myungsuensis TaxID=649104 RepID=A0A929PYV6_9SPHI|nr:glycoside hydrolase family 125 protein [Mucilaginibacter myungsuensis]MBE9664671.1 glycoside hydrolase family 125 protein [Mucilaginibacter myungsuensis]MDN3601124.1 glycoside hydrolase family 125 protein [Mucilaginibacter myungsuensis]
MQRRTFLRNTSLLASAVMVNKLPSFAAAPAYPVVRVKERNFTSTAVEAAIQEFQSKVKDPELAWLFNNCFPNTLDTTVTAREKGGKPDTYVITGDIDAMWLRDSSAQVYPYLHFVKQDSKLRNLVAGVINRQAECVLKDPYANAFYDDPNKVGEWSKDETKMQPGLHERKWEIDSLCYPIRLAYKYWKITGDTSPFTDTWKSSIAMILKTFKEQQRKTNQGPYSFQRRTSWATDGVPMAGYGYPVKPVGLICSTFRPSDDATIFLYLIPSNFFAVTSLRQAAEMVSTISKDNALATDLRALATEVDAALKKHAVINHPTFGKVYAYEVNGFGSYVLMDDANVPSLLGLPYLDAMPKTDPVYLNTRKMLLSANNPFFFKGKAGEGIGGPHVGKDMIWPLSIIIRGMTSTNDAEIKQCITMLKNAHGDTGFMHESFHKDDAKNFTRKWFAWANTLFGEFLWETYKAKPHLLA